MHPRWRIILALLPLTAISFWIIYELEEDADRAGQPAALVPDYTMTDLNSLNMDAQGRPSTRLTADYMAHYESKNETELTQPQLQMFRADQPSLFVRADRGWVTSGNEVILLRGDVRFWEPNEAGDTVLEVTTSEARVYPERDYAETDKAATLKTPETSTDSIGMKAYLQEGRIEMLNNVHTTITDDAIRPDN